MNFIQDLYEMTSKNIGYDIAYDVFKIVLGFVIAKVGYELIYMKRWWGGWKIKVQDGTTNLVTRNISPAVAKRVMSDGSDFSVFVKGVASTFFWVNHSDMSLEQANKTGLLQVDSDNKLIIIDKAHNPASPQKTNITNEQVMEKLLELEAKLNTEK